MNLVFIIGKIVSDIKFDFVLNSKKISIISFELELNNKSIARVKGFDEVADFCYSKLIVEDIVNIFGILNSNGEIIIQEIN